MKKWQLLLQGAVASYRGTLSAALLSYCICSAVRKDKSPKSDIFHEFFECYPEIKEILSLALREARIMLFCGEAWG